MSLKSLKRLRKTLGFRLTLWYSGLFILSTLTLFAVAYFLLSASMQRRDRETLRLELAEHAHEYQRGGVEAIERRVAFEKTQTGKTIFFVRVAWADNTTLFLNYRPRWKQFDLQQLEKKNAGDTPPWLTLSATDDDDEVLEIASLHLPDGAWLQVGKTTDDREDLLERFGGLFAIVLIPVVVIGVAGGA